MFRQQCSFAKYLILNLIKYPEAVCYDIDNWPNQFQQMRTNSSTGSGKRKRYKSKNKMYQTITFTWDLNEIIRHGSFLSREDVLNNIGLYNVCEECHVFSENVQMCVGCYPSNVGFAFPHGCKGRQHSCHRAVLCSACFDGASEGDHKWKELPGRKYLCSHCSSEHKLTIADVYGHNIIEPTFQLLGNDSVHPTASPSILHAAQIDVRSPAEMFQSDASTRIRRSEEGARRSSASGGASAIQASTIFMRACNSVYLSLGQDDVLLETLQSLHEQGLLVEGTNAKTHKIMLPRDTRTLSSRSSAEMISDEDLRIRSVHLSAHNLQQIQDVISIHIGDVRDAIQSIILDERLDHSLMFHSSTDLPYTYCNEDGDSLQMPELYNGQMWKDCESTVPPGGFMLGIVINSDGTISRNGSRHPFWITVGNYALSQRRVDAGVRMLAMGPSLSYHRGRGGQSSSLNDEQKAARRNIFSCSAAHILAELDVLASGPVSFLVRDPESGGTKIMEFYIRIVLIDADYEEKKLVLGLSSSPCPRCLFLREACGLEESEGRVFGRNANIGSAWPYMRLDVRCVAARKRTVEATLEIAASLANTLRTQGIEAARAESKYTGVPWDSENFLARLVNVLPHSIGAPYRQFSPDTLHAFQLGVAKRFNQMLEETFNAFKASTPHFRSLEDVRYRIDCRIATFGPFPGRKKFNTGWWESANLDGASGEECLALLHELLFVYIGDNLLIPDVALRRRVLKLHLDLIMFGKEIMIPQIYLDREIQELDDLVVSIGYQMWEFQCELAKKGACPGQGMNIIKFHELTSAASCIREFGSLTNGDTGAFEKLNKLAKLEDDKIVRSRKDCGNKLLFKRCLRKQCDSAIKTKKEDDVADADADVTAWVSQKGTSEVFHIGAGYHWELLVAQLGRGEEGPAINPQSELLTEITQFLRVFQLSNQPDVKVRFSKSIRVREEDLHTHIVVGRRLVSGNCIQLNDDRFAQVVLPNVHRLSYGKWTPMSRLVVNFFDFVEPRLNRGRHSDVAITWLARESRLTVISDEQVRRRARIVPLYEGGDNDIPCEPFPASFLVDETVFPLYVGPHTREVYFIIKLLRITNNP